MAHSYARLAHQAGSLHSATIAAVADVARVPEAIAAVQPAILPAVPRVYEKIHANALGEIERAGGMQARIGLWAVSVGGRVSRVRRAGRKPWPWLALQHKVADKLVFAKGARGSAASSASASPARRRSRSR